MQEQPRLAYAELTDNTAEPRRNVWQALRRGLRRRCPACGEGRLFDGYIRPAASCSACGEPTGDIRADDGPAWLTILVTGHLVSPLFLMFSHEYAPAPWLPLVIVLAVTLGLVFALLPMAKGVFIGVIWATRARETVADREALDPAHANPG